MADALFERDGDRFLPTELARGPWSPNALHGGPSAALLARAAERFEGSEGMLVTRVTVELLRPVPVAPLVLTAHLRRPGRKVQLIEVSLSAGPTEVARATALRIRILDLPVPPERDAPAPPSGSESGRPARLWGAPQADYPAFHNLGVDHRIVAGGFDRPGPTTDWIRLRVPVVAGEPVSALERVAAAADFGNGISWVVPRLEGWQFINPDLTIVLHRHPMDEWVCLEAETMVQSSGIGLAESRLWDRSGRLGRAVQSLLIDRD